MTREAETFQEREIYDDMEQMFCILFDVCYLFLFLSEIGVHSKVQIFVYLEFDFVVAAESECFNLHTQLYYWLK